MGSAGGILRAVLAVANSAVSAPVELGLAAKRAKDGMESPAGAAKDAADAQRKAANDLASEAGTRRANEEGAAAATTDAAAARSRQRAKSDAAQGRRGTILTGPLGLVDDATVQRKTILGA